MESMTLKQHAKFHFLRLCEAYATAEQQLDTPEGKRAFVELSVQLHIAKGEVPKRMWPLINHYRRAARASA